MAGRIRLLSGGAAQGLVRQLQDRFTSQTGCTVEGTFGAVGAMRDKLLAGEPCDLVIFSQALVDQLMSDHHLVPGSAVPLARLHGSFCWTDGRHGKCPRHAVLLKTLILSYSYVSSPGLCLRFFPGVQ